MEIQIQPDAYMQLEKYVYLYETYFIEFFSDTGIWSEDIIQENYRKTAKHLFREMLS
jgi:hypothetical protein